MTKIKTKNTLIFTGMSSQKYGAFEHYNVELAKQLFAKGIKPIFVYNNEPNSLNYINDLLKNHAEIKILNPKKGIIHKIKNIYKLIRIYKPYVVHTHFNPSIVRLVCYISFLLRVPKRYNTFHCMTDSKKIITKLWMYSLSLLSTKQFAISEAIRQEQIEIFKTPKSKIITLRLGLNKKLFKTKISKDTIRTNYNLPKKDLLIANIAFHDPVKGIDVLLEAFSIIKHKGYNSLYLCQIGGIDSNYSSYLKEKSKALDIESNIIWMGIQNDVPNLLGAFDIYVQPSRNEGLGLAILEAYYAKLPVVGANVGGIPEIVDNNKGFLFESENAQDLANKLLALIDSKSLRAEKGEKAYQFVNTSYNLIDQVKAVCTYY